MRNMTCALLAILLASVLAVETSRAQSTRAPYQPTKDSAVVPRQPYERYFTRDRFGREITFYLSEARTDQPPSPLVVYVHGSGCGSLFRRRDGAVAPTSGHISVLEAAGESAALLIVEKPGVKFLDQPQQGCGEASEFNREHTLERWAEAVAAAVQAARQLPRVRKDKTLVIGHSEGGVVASRVARDLPAVVTHVAVMAGEGPSQLFSLLRLARKGVFFRDISEDPDRRAAFILEQWRQIQADPDSAEKFFFGFAYRRWSTFLATSPMEELANVKAGIYLAQGGEDAAVDPAATDALYAQLVARGRTVTYDRVEGADHSFNIKGSPHTNGWREQLGRIMKWFVGQ